MGFGIENHPYTFLEDKIVIYYTQQFGDQFSNALTVLDRTIAYGLGGDDILSTSTGISALVGGSGVDSYIVANNSVAIVLDDGNSAGDVVVATGIGLNSSSTVILEIDYRHFIAYDTYSGQTLIILDWQNATNIIESVQLSDGTFPYEYIASNFRSTTTYYGNYTIEQADTLFMGGKLAANGITNSSIDQLISIAKATNAWFGGASNPVGLGGNSPNEAGTERLISGNGKATYVANNTNNAALIERSGNDTLTSGPSMTHSLAMVEPIALPSVLQINVLSPLPILALAILLRSLLLVLKLD